MVLLAISLLLFILIMKGLNPKLDETIEGDVLLWYTSYRGKRNYIVVWERN
jgi:hypothetical protein